MYPLGLSGSGHEITFIDLSVLVHAIPSFLCYKRTIFRYIFIPRLMAHAFELSDEFGEAVESKRAARVPYLTKKKMAK